MSVLDNPDFQARQDIEKLKQDQYAQSELVRAAHDLGIRNSEQIAGIEANHGRRIGELEHKSMDCDTKHEAHNHHRRKSDQEMSVITSTLQESLAVNKQMQETMTKLLTTVELHAPTVERSQKSYTTLDGVKSFLLYVGCISAAFLFIQHILEIIQK